MFTGRTRTPNSALARQQKSIVLPSHTSAVVIFTLSMQSVRSISRASVSGGLTAYSIPQFHPAGTRSNRNQMKTKSTKVVRQSAKRPKRPNMWEKSFLARRRSLSNSPKTIAVCAEVHKSRDRFVTCTVTLDPPRKRKSITVACLSERSCDAPK